MYGETLAAWSKLAGSIARGPSNVVLLESFRRMVDAANRDAIVATQRLSGLFAQTEALFPGAGDPLNKKLHIASNRWLAQSNENSYSDWLAWIVDRQDDPSRVLPLFGISARSNAGARWTVEREVVTPYGRLDLLLRNTQLGVLCVEVKTDSVPSPDQLERYRNWLAGQRSQFSLVLLAIEPPEDDPPSEKYHFCSWKHISLSLRTWATAWLGESGKLYDAVMTLAFCGAVERNLLLLGGGGLNALRTADYLEEVLGYDDAKTTPR